MKWLSIRILSALLGFAIGVITPFALPKRIEVANVQTNSADTTSLAFEGTVLKLGPRVPGSGVMAFYRLAKYRVERVSSGHYSGSEIVVDHVSMTGDELETLRIGDRVCVSVLESNKIFSVSRVPGIREESERVELFYIGGDVNREDSYCRK